MQDTALDTPKITALSFAHGQVGQEYPLTGEAAEKKFGECLGRNTRPVTIENTAFCADERLILHFAALGKGYETMEDYALNVIAPQFLGGLGLHATKAAVAANVPIIRNARTFTEAYLLVSQTLADMGQLDGGHDDCGASGSVEKSIGNQIQRDSLLSALSLFIPNIDAVRQISDQITENKSRRLGDGFYGGWKPQNHKDYLISRFPQHFATLRVDSNHPTHGHHGSGILIINRNGMGFAKNQFIRETGQESFAVTVWKMHEIARCLGGSDDERARLLVAFLDDALHVTAGLVTEGMPVFASGTNADIVNPISFNN